ncbi:groeL [Caudoviricetes sp.]|nr:groeL [Caudoviricetes sp.]
MEQNPKKVLIGKDAKEKAMAGVEIVYQAVSNTFGARSYNVAIGRPFGRPAVVHDGVTVAKEVLPLEDPFEDVGAQIAVEAADKTNSVGDGTTTATILTREIAKSAHTYIAAGARPMALREGIEVATDAIIEELGTMATPIEKVEDVRRIATVSAQNEEIGNMVAEAYEELGREGIMTVEESKSHESFLELKKGMEIDRGYASPYFINDEKLGEATLESPEILVTDMKITNNVEFGQMMERLYTEGSRNIVIVADEISGEPLAFSIINNAKGTMRVLCVNAPSFGDKRIDILKDIAITTGATFITEQAGMTLKNVKRIDLGSAARVTSNKDTTLIVDGAGAEEDIAARADEIKTKAENPDTGEFDREKYMERLAKMSSGVAVLTMGAKSEPEVKERKERAIDAISAAKAALQDGIVPGGGVALLAAATNACDKLGKDKRAKQRDFNSGVELVREACYAPFRKLMDNAGFDSGQMFEKLSKEPVDSGVDVTDGAIKDMVKTGIIDPVLVVGSALGNASSAAVMLATTNVIIVEKKVRAENPVM